MATEKHTEPSKQRANLSVVRPALFGRVQRAIYLAQTALHLNAAGIRDRAMNYEDFAAMLVLDAALSAIDEAVGDYLEICHSLGIGDVGLDEVYSVAGPQRTVCEAAEVEA